ncbi:MAG: hypothetical protein GEV06_06275 [Luteitalea sp.]|nr:hypothetical protein [Luteitalea sp.]
MAVAASILLPSASVSVQEERRTLQNVLHDIGLNARDVRTVESGRPVSMLLSTDLAHEIAVFGSVRIDVSAATFVERFRDIARFESGESVRQIGTFRQPPTLDDVKALRMPLDDLRALSQCEIGKCAVKLPAEAMTRIRREGGGGTSARARADAILKDMLVGFVTAYRAQGNGALPELSDQDQPLRSGDAFEEMLEESSSLLSSQPELSDYLRSYPRARLANADDFFYWSLVDFGIKPTLRVNHVTIYQPPPDRGIDYAIASKQIYASHYFDAALELKFLVEDPLQEGLDRVYLLVVNRARIGGLTGLLRALIRPSARRRTRDALDRYLRSTKARLEQASAEAVTR